MALQLPPWPTRSPGSLVAVALQRGAILHLLAIVDTWSLTSSPPLSLRDRFAEEWRWSKEGPVIETIAEKLAELGRAWFAEVPDEVGVLDVLGAVTHSGGGALGSRRGPWGNLVHGNLAGDFGRVRSDPQWPTLAHVTTHAEGVAIAIPAAPNPIVVRTATELGAQLPAITELMRAADDACASATLRQLELRAAAERLRAAIPPLAGTWSPSVPYMLDVAAPSVTITSGAPIGGTASIRLTGRGERGVTIDVGSFVHEAADVGAVDALVPKLHEAYGREAHVLRSWRLVSGRSYRVKRDLRHLSPGSVVEFREVYEVKPSGADHWAFVSAAGALTLASDDAADVAILDALDDYLEPIL